MDIRFVSVTWNFELNGAMVIKNDRISKSKASVVTFYKN